MSKYKILTSCRGLGPYIAAVLLKQSLKESSQEITIELPERSYSRDQVKKLKKEIQSYQTNLRRAEIGMHVYSATHETSVSPELELEADCEYLLLSGDWCPNVSNSYAKRSQLILLDAGLAPSWQRNSQDVTRLAKHGATIRKLTTPDGEVCEFIGLDVLEPGPTWDSRSNRIVIHGGGWALGDLYSAVARLVPIGFEIDLLIGTRHPLANLPETVRQYRFPDDWNPWSAPPDKPFPPLINDDGETYSKGNTHGAYSLIRNSKGLITKPGAMSLHEALISMTPILFLEPYGAHERANCEYWLGRGLGIKFDEWLNEGSQIDALTKLHNRLSTTRSISSSFVV